MIMTKFFKALILISYTLYVDFYVSFALYCNLIYNITIQRSI